MEISKHDIRILLMHEYRLGNNATVASNKICQTMGKSVVSVRTAQDWFKKFKEGYSNLDDRPRAGRPLDINIDELNDLIEQDPRQTTRCLAELFGCSHTTIESSLKALGKIYKYGVWIPHQLSPIQLKMRVDTCMELLSFQRTYEWLTNLITGDEKWVLYVNYARRKQWLSSGERGVDTPKPGLHPKKVMLSVWWNIRGVVHWELLPPNTTITAEIYCEQLDRLALKLKKKQDKVYFLHDNARPHVAKLTNFKLLELGWTVIPHAPYSPDLAPTDYHLFLSLSSYLRDRNFTEESEIFKSIEDFFNSKSQDFYRNGIMKLPSRWRQVVESNGAYISNN